MGRREGEEGCGCMCVSVEEEEQGPREEEGGGREGREATGDAFAGGPGCWMVHVQLVLGTVDAPSLRFTLNPERLTLTSCVG